ncbi:MAG: DUF4349 domain-containing protein [Alphaproteobacteria bacterium]|nr:DUF4349 domain-containing protein [Alphaproteobacteria bacterium]MCB9795689.1 DUF4349 domain-containing protein [Alphaproteobacteria bacterium]
MSLLLTLILGLAFAEEPTATSSPTVESAPAPASSAHVSASITVAVTQRDAAAKTLVDAAEDMGGWFAALSDTSVDLRVPADKADALIELALAQGLVTQRSYSSVDLTPRLVELTARLKARQDMLDRYFAILPDAGAKAVVTVEREIVALVAEIEGLQGQLRVLEHQAQWAQVSVSFQSRSRAAPTRDGSSSFAWINTLNLADLLDSFRYGSAPYGSKRAGLGPLQAEGFSPYRKVRRERRAASPDGVVLRVRAEAHEPQADAPFWKEAVTERMAAAGYILLSEQNIEVDGRAGFALEFTAPMGNSDYGYLIAVIPAGRKLYVAELGGELIRYQARRQAALDAILALEL